MIKNQKIADKIIEMIDNLITSSEELKKLDMKFYYSTFELISINMIKVLNVIYDVILKIEKQELEGKLELACESILDSLQRIIKLSHSRSLNISNKIEFELIPLLEELRFNFYYWACIFPNSRLIKEFYEDKISLLSFNKYIELSETTNKYRYDLSIMVWAFNKLEYTKICVESILKYAPKNINYELILINHGSHDGTKEYFERIVPTKQLDIYKNGGGLLSATRIVEGKFVLAVSNDVVVTKNSILNMMNCMNSDEKIGYIVPTTPNVSNFQTIESDYNNLNEMFEFASKNNIYNPNRWEQRVRLCNPICMFRSSVWYSSKGVGAGRYYLSTNTWSFPDDTVSLLFRRSGYKMILVKDAYCYHYGSITLKDELEQQDYYSEERKKFYNFFGIDPWGTGFCWDPGLFQHLPCNEKGHIDILGINCGIGSNPLKVKESIKENVHNLDVKIYNITDEKCYIEDLKGVSDSAEYIENLVNIEDIINGMKFNYIIFESKMDIYNNPLSIFNKLFIHLEKGGFLSIKMSNTKVKKEIKKTCSNYREVGEWLVINNI